MLMILTLLKKDILLELRNREALTLVVCLAILLSMVVSFGFAGTLLGSSIASKMYPTFLWVVFVFSATISIGRSFEYELRDSALDGLLLSGVSPVWVYLSKVASNAFVIAIGHVVSVFTLAAFMNVSIGVSLCSLLTLSFFVIIAYSSLATLLSALTATSRLAGMLLPLVLLPLLFPLFFAAVELSMLIIEGDSLSWESPWFSVIIGLDVLYLLLGINLFEHVVVE